MTEIAEDVMKAAIKCAETVCRNLEYDDVSIEVTEIARAIQAERERCAKVCRDRVEHHMFKAGFARDGDGNWVLGKLDRETYDSHVSRSNEALFLAAAIRSSAPEPTP